MKFGVLKKTVLDLPIPVEEEPKKKKDKAEAAKEEVVEVTEEAKPEEPRIIIANALVGIFDAVSALQRTAFQANDKVVYGFATKLLTGELMDIKANYSKDATVVISTHLIEDIEPVLDEAVFLKDGKIFAHRAVDDIRETEGKSVDAYFREVFKC